MRNVILFFTLFVLIQITSYAITVFVSPKGDDNNPGNQNKPLRSIQRAIDVTRAAGDEIEKSVVLLEGMYPLDRSIQIGQRDVSLSIIADKHKTARLVGGKLITGFQKITNKEALNRLPESARNAVRQCDLKAQGITDYGELQLRGFGRPNNPSAMELFINGKAMTLARWPNTDWATIADVPNGKDGGMFTYDGSRPERWANAPDIWLHGYWTQDWADSYTEVSRIDTKQKAVHTKDPHGVYGYTKGKRWRAMNLLEELDSPGEYYIDRSEGVLYLFPRESLKGAQAIVSILEKPIFDIRNAKDVTISGLTLDCSRGSGIEIRDSEHVRIAGCTLRNLGQRGVTINGGKFTSVMSCDIYDVGEGGITINGGDRKTLTPANHSAVNNDIYRYARWVRTYRPAISLQGVGNRIAHNRIHDAPHTGVLFGGNDHALEYNEVFNLCWESGDVGAFYIGRNWTMRGHLIRHNYFYDITGPHTHGAQAIYLDDAASGVTMRDNIFRNADIGAFIGGGRDNRVENNLMIDCGYATHIDKRGRGWAQKYIVKGGGWKMYEKLKEVNYKEPPYSVRYPELVTILNERPHYPVGNVFANNVSYSKKWMRNQSVDEDDLLMKDNYHFEPTDNINWEKVKFQLPKDHPALNTGYKQIPFEKIGLFTDEHRKSTR